MRLGVGLPSAMQQPARVAPAAEVASRRLQAPTGLAARPWGPGRRGDRETLALPQLSGSIRDRGRAQARIGDPDASVDDEADPDNKPPSLWHKVFGALFYLIPWMDVSSLGLGVYQTFKSTWILAFLIAPLTPTYYASQFIPLVVFFVVFLAVVRNKKIPHVVRFNACQAIMIDITAMMFNLVRMYFPAEVRWSVLLDFFDRYAYIASMATILYCVFWTLRGYYADLPWISEASYIQVELAEVSG